MKRTAPRAAVLLVLLAGLVVGGGSVAHEGATGVVAERMHGMKSMAEDMKALAEMLDGKRPFSADDAKARVASLHHTCHQAQDLFSNGKNDHASRALPAIWEHPDAFAAAMAGFDRAVEALMTATQTASLESLRAPFLDVGRQCSSCHEDFRRPQ
ncbi:MULTISPECIES: c-type cytochrome [Chelativorans]|jgi:cytochrome c556|uniref:Cytochrome c, class II n=1 Tax=Chelativorans sp. (strain BNC1) TaxID=266779 RepID=Q11MI3_CHESB|nr:MULTISPECIES: cytochrome c [Chelativorans]